MSINNMKSFFGLSINLLGGLETSFMESIRSIVPPLSHSYHKGTMGRIAIIGGSRDYTGAPYYAAESALKFGADLSFIYCSNDAAIPIKCYSPELMVTPFYNDNLVLKAAETDEPILRHEVNMKHRIFVVDC